MRILKYACAVLLLAALFGGKPAFSQAPPDDIFLISRRHRTSAGNAVLVHRDPDCLLTAAHVVGFEGELVDAYARDDRGFTGAVIKRSKTGSLENPGDRMGLALIMLYPNSLPLPASIPVQGFSAYRADEVLDIWAILRVRNASGAENRIARTTLRLWSPAEIDAELIGSFDPSRKKQVQDVISLLLAFEAGGDKVRTGFSGSAVRNAEGFLVGIVQAIVFWFDGIEYVGFTPHRLIVQFLADTPCNPLH